MFGQEQDVAIRAEDLKELIGRGGFGTVYKLTRGDTEYALKHFRSARAERDKEAHILGQLDHENVIRFIGLSEGPGESCGFLLELMGPSLKKLIERLPENFEDPNLILSTAREIVAGLRYIHGKSILHCDLKSDNVLVSPGGDGVKIADFGTAIHKKGGLESAIKLSKFVGTSIYGARESHRDNEYSDKSDVYTLSWIIWEMLHRQTLSQYLESIGMEECAFIWKLGKEGIHLPIAERFGLKALIERLWDDKPSKRPTLEVVDSELESLRKLELLEAKAPAVSTVFARGVESVTRENSDPNLVI